MAPTQRQVPAFAAVVDGRKSPVVERAIVQRGRAEWAEAALPVDDRRPDSVLRLLV